jgi:PPE-repeat protein
MLDFSALKPEINSAKIYSGPGAMSWTTAASAWNALAAELNSAAMGYENVVTQLSSEEWLGTASTAMASAVAPHVAWMKTTAAQAEEAATKANSAAVVFEQTFASMVPPTEIAANRATLAQAVATNVIGQNTAIIAQLEALYAEMWAQDATAMYTYAGQMAVITNMTPLQNPPQIASQDAGAKQTASTAATTANSSAGNAQNAVSKAIANLSSPSTTTTSAAADPSSGGLLALLGLAPNTDTSNTGLAGVLNYLDGSNGSLLGSFLNNPSVSGISNGFTTNGDLNPTSFIDSVTTFSYLFPKAGADAAAGAAADLAAGLGPAGGLGALPGLGASAGIGQASMVGALSVPQAWGATGATITPVVATTHLGAGAYQGLGATPMVMEDAGAVGMPGMPVGAIGAGAHEDEFSAPIYGFRPRVIGRPPAAG